MNKFLSIIIIFFSLISNTIANPSIQARTGILIDYHSGEILFELEFDEFIKLSISEDKLLFEVLFELDE